MFNAAFWTGLMTVLWQLAVPIIKRIAVALGIGALAFPAGTFLIDQAKDFLVSFIQQYASTVQGTLPISGVLGIFGLLQVDKALNILFSAFAARMAYSMFDRVVVKPVWNPPGRGGGGPNWEA